MRKLNLILGMFIVFALLLTACGGMAEEGEGTDTAFQQTDDTFLDETDDGFGDETTVPLETPLGGEATVDIVETDVLETEVVETETIVVDETPMANETLVIPTTGMVDRGLISNLLDFEVYDSNNESIGDVEDFILSIDNQQIEYVIVEVGGFLGIGAKQVAIPYDRLVLSEGMADDDMQNDDTDVADATVVTQDETPAADDAADTDETDDMDGQEDLYQDNVFLLDVTAEELKNSPEFNRDTFANLGETFTADWDADYKNFWAGDMTVTTDEETKTETPEADVIATTEATQTEGEVMGMSELQGVVLANDLLDLDVQDQEGNDLGNVNNVVVDPESGEIRYLLLNVTGIEAMENRQMLVPLDAVTWNYDADNGVLVLPVDQQVLSDAPTFEDGQLPDTMDPEWGTEIDTYWSSYNQS